MNAISGFCCLASSSRQLFNFLRHCHWNEALSIFCKIVCSCDIDIDIVAVDAVAFFFVQVAVVLNIVKQTMLDHSYRQSLMLNIPNVITYRYMLVKVFILSKTILLNFCFFLVIKTVSNEHSFHFFFSNNRIKNINSFISYELKQKQKNNVKEWKLEQMPWRQIHIKTMTNEWNPLFGSEIKCKSVETELGNNISQIYLFILCVTIVKYY